MRTRTMFYAEVKERPSVPRGAPKIWRVATGIDALRLLCAGSLQQRYPVPKLDDLLRDPPDDCNISLHTVAGGIEFCAGHYFRDAKLAIGDDQGYQ